MLSYYRCEFCFLARRLLFFLFFFFLVLEDYVETVGASHFLYRISPLSALALFLLRFALVRLDIIKLKKNVSCEIEDLVETLLCKL